MNDSTQFPKKASPKQLRLLRRLAEERGVSFAYPETWEQADLEIKRMKKSSRTSGSERHRERKAVRDAVSHRGDAAAVRPEEVSGYGSTARWS